MIRSGSVDFELPKPVQPPPIRQVKTAPHMMTTTPQAMPTGTIRIAQNAQVILSLCFAVQQSGLLCSQALLLYSNTLISLFK